jgi:plastocyanin
VRATRARRALVAATLVVVASAGAVAIAAPGSAQAAAPAVRKVKVGDNFFKPKTLRIVAGTTVQWTNVGGNVHNIVPNKGKLFGLRTMVPDKKYKFTFTKPGKYAYYCSFHGSPGVGQHGTVIVTAPPPTTTTTPPST